MAKLTLPPARQTAVIRTLVVHSPLVGPATVRRLSASLDALGWTTVTPDLRASVDSADAFWRAAVAACEAADVVVGHSGAGAFLPVIADTIGATPIFVDAVLPSAGAAFEPSAALLDLLERIPCVNGSLAPWHEWWPEETVAQLLPDGSVRDEITRENPRVPRSFYEESVPLPAQWPTRAAAYLQLSDAYAAERAIAHEWGWPTHSLPGRHLDLVVRPDQVAHHVADLGVRTARSEEEQ